MSLDILCLRLAPLVLHPSPESGYISGVGLAFTQTLIQQASVLCRVLCWARGIQRGRTQRWPVGNTDMQTDMCCMPVRGATDGFRH